MPYYACYGGYGSKARYAVKLADSREDLIPDSASFRAAPDEFSSYDECLSFVHALNIHLRGNIPLDDSDEDLEC